MTSKNSLIIKLSSVVFAAFIFGIWIVAYELSVIDYQETINRAERDATNLARILSEHVEKTIVGIDFVLLHSAKDFMYGRASHDTFVDLYQTATRMDNTLIQIAYANDKGEVVISSSNGVSGASIADREHFIVHKEKTVTGLFISRPVFGRVSQKWSIQLSRRVENQNGEFTGVVVASIDPFYFGRIFNEIEVGPNGLISIFKPDGNMLARKDMTATVLQTNVSGSELFTAVSNNKKGFGRFRSQIDNSTRFAAYQQLSHHPIYVATGFDSENFMREHSKRNFYLVLASTLITILISGTFVGVLLHTKSVHKINKELSESQQLANASNQSKTMFLANMSHEIRTPMNAVLGLCDLIAKTQLTDKQKDYFLKISASTRSLLVIINDILDISKIESGELQLDCATFSLSVVLENVANVAAYSATQKRINLVYDVGADVPLLFKGDQVRLGQILINLVNNAIKFTQAGNVIISIKVDQDFTNGHRLYFSVSDTGIGMTSEQQQAIFRPFVQADNTTTRRFGGTGLGLVICKRLCSAMGGEIRVSSHLGIGSTFSFDVILGSEPGSKTIIELLDKNIASANFLVVDDIEPERTAVYSFIKAMSPNVTVAESGMDALEEIALSVGLHKPYDVIIINAFMADMDGLDVVRIIKSDPSLNPCPKFVIMFPYGYDDSQKVPDELHECQLISKPLSNIRLMASIAECLDHKIDISAFINTIKSDQSAIKFIDVKALLVDDNEINRQIAKELLEQAGINVEMATNGLEAVNLVNGNPNYYDIVLMDVQMPEMDGITATKIIRETFSANDLPIVAMTAHAMEQERLRCLSAGMNDHVSKPISIDALHKSLSVWLRGKVYSDCVTDRNYQTFNVSDPDILDDGLPHNLHPFDLPSAIVNVNNNRLLIKSMLIKFVELYESAPVDILNLFENGNLSELQRLAHTLKGVAGSLQAKAATIDAASLEKALMNGSYSELKSLVEALALSLQEALTAARTIKHDT